MKNIKEEKLIPPQKDKSHQQLVKENWDEADKIFMKALMEPVDQELFDEIYPELRETKETK
tara:strand:- start:58 stop:240 length:183 start_codon:yes stop_codon:yes gene_type:complete